MKPSPAWLKKIEEKDLRFSGAALYGFGYILRHTAPAICMADRKLRPILKLYLKQITAKLIVSFQIHM